MSLCPAPPPCSYQFPGYTDYAPESRKGLGQDRAELILQSEEHGVFRIPRELPRVGDYLLAVPGHICPTTIRYPGIHGMDTAGEVVDYYFAGSPVDRLKQYNACRE